MDAAPRPGRARALAESAPFALPLFAALVVLVAPVLFAQQRFYLRDVLNVHHGMASARALAIAAGRLPLFDPFHGGGRPLAGNPNALAFHPGLLVDLVAPGRATDAHLVIHLLLAPLAMFACGRALGLGRPGAWTAAAFYAAGGFLLSHLSFANLIGGAALAPALIAAAVAVARGWRPPVASALLAFTWGLLLLSGDPWLAVFALALAVTAALAMRERAPGTPARDPARKRSGRAAPRPAGARAAAFPARRALLFGLLGLALGTLLAAPQIVETLRLLPISARGGGLSLDQRLTESWDPRQALEWIVPFAFGRPDVLGPGRFWGHAYYGGVPPLYLSLHAGVLALVTAIAAGRPRTPAAWWAVGAIVAGVALALGRFDPIARAVFSLPPLATFRYPIKAWLAVAIGLALLAGIAADRWCAGDESALRRGRRTALVLAIALGALAAALALAPAAALRGAMPGWVDAAFADFERVRNAGAAALQAAIAGAAALLLVAAGRQPARRLAWIAALVAIHTVSEAVVLRPLATATVMPELDTAPALLAALPPDSTIVHAGGPGAFEATPLHRLRYPDRGRGWTARQAAWALQPFTGPRWGRRYELDATPERLEPLATVTARALLAQSNDAERVRLLSAWGVARLVLGRPLPDSAGARLVMHAERFGGQVYVYDLPRRAPPAFVAATTFPLRNPEAARRLIVHPEFDPARDVVVDAPETRPVEGSGGTARLTDLGDERLKIEATAGPAGGMLVVQRTPALRTATLDGRPVPVRTVNVHRTGVELPPGTHVVMLDIDRAPARLGLMAGAVALLACVALLAIGVRAGAARRPQRPAAS